MSSEIEWNMPGDAYFNPPKEKKKESPKPTPKPPAPKKRYKVATSERRDARLQRHYKMTLLEFEELLDSQDRVCAICRQPDMDWHVDHDHACCPGNVTCGKCVRGILCRACNWTIGKMQDNPEWLRAAAKYVEDNARGR